MKKILSITIIIFILLAFGLSAQDNSEEGSSEAYMATVNGLLEYGAERQICIISDWALQTRTAYYVSGDLAQELSENPGMFAEVEGVVTNSEFDPYLKYIEVTNIVEITNQPYSMQ